MVQINDQPEYKDSHRQNHLQQSTLKSATIQKHHLLLQACSLISNLHLKKNTVSNLNTIQDSIAAYIKYLFIEQLLKVVHLLKCCT